MLPVKNTTPVMNIYPNGHFFISILSIIGTIAVKALVGAAIGGGTTLVGGLISGKSGAELWNGVAAGMIYGSIAGFGIGISAGLGSVVGALKVAGVAVGLGTKVALGVTGAVISGISGGVARFAENSFLSKKTSASDIVMHSILSAISGGGTYLFNIEMVSSGFKLSNMILNQVGKGGKLSISEKIFRSSLAGLSELSLYKGLVSIGKNLYDWLTSN